MEGHLEDLSSSELQTSVINISVDSPPSYEACSILQPPHNRRKYDIQPREDEGREVLPAYSSEISLQNVFSRKVELEGAVHRASDRNWYRVFVTLQGTAMTFHKYKTSAYFSAWSSESGRSDTAVPEKKGTLFKSYNLQHADVGIAADYIKYVVDFSLAYNNLQTNIVRRKRYVIRVRAETDQFLLSCFKIETFVNWLQSLFAAIDIAPPLDSRSLPRDFSIPRARQRRVTCSIPITDLERNAALAREQYEIMRRQYPSMVEESNSEGVEPLNTNSATVEVQRPSTLRALTAPAQVRTSASIDFLPTLSDASRQIRCRAHSTPALPSSTAVSETHPSISSEPGKWRPEHHWSTTYDMLYAKRCMAVLTSRSPRKSDIVIMKGKQWIVDWATGTLTRCQPPDYGEIVVN